MTSASADETSDVTTAPLPRTPSVSDPPTLDGGCCGRPEQSTGPIQAGRDLEHDDTPGTSTFRDVDGVDPDHYAFDAVFNGDDAVPSCERITRAYIGTEVATCTGSGDCNVDQPGNYECSQGVCLHPCAFDTDCPFQASGETCDIASGFCHHNGEPSPENRNITCISNGDCAPYAMACEAQFNPTVDYCAATMSTCAVACSIDPDEPDLACPTGMVCDIPPDPGPADEWFLSTQLLGQLDSSSGGFQLCPNDDPPGNRECANSYYCETIDQQKICVWQKKFCQTP